MMLHRTAHGTGSPQILTEQLGMEYDVELDRRTRRQDELQLGRALEYGRLDHELTLQRQEWQQEEDRCGSAIRQHSKLQHLEVEKIDFYQKCLEAGDVRAWATHLAANPQDSWLVINSMREDQLRMIEAQMELVQELLGGDNAEDYELEGLKQLALRALSDVLNQRLPGIPGGWSSSPSPATLAPPRRTCRSATTGTTARPWTPLNRLGRARSRPPRPLAPRSRSRTVSPL
jgi:hypothetical protein